MTGAGQVPLMQVESLTSVDPVQLWLTQPALG
jgi:hypothetical protein